MKALATGRGQGEVASDLGVSVDTVHKNVTATYRKLGAANLIEAFVLMGWLNAHKS